MRCALLVAGAFACLLAAALRGDATVATLALVALVALAPVSEVLALPSEGSGRRQTATFALIVAAAGLGGWQAALAVGLIAFASEEWLGVAARGRVLILRPLILVGLVGAGVLVRDVALLVAPLMLVWSIAIGIWLVDRVRQRRFTSILPATIALAWLVANLSMPLWLPVLPQAARDLLESSTVGLRFAAGFMTVDSLLGSALGFRRTGLHGLRFWRMELLPTFARYNLMAALGALFAAALLTGGVAGTIVAFVGLTGGILAQVVRLESAHAHRRLVATVCALSTALDARDPCTRGHSDRVAAYAVGIAEQLGWSKRERKSLELAGHLHDIGKIGVPDAILGNPGRLTPEEFAVIQRHAEQSAAIVRNIPEFRPIAEVIWQHHERLDGSGYPRGLEGEAIVPAARILAVADSFDAMTSNRAYRAALPTSEAMRRIVAERDIRYDARVVEALRLLVAEQRVEGVLAYTYCLSH